MSHAVGFGVTPEEAETAFERMANGYGGSYDLAFYRPRHRWLQIRSVSRMKRARSSRNFTSDGSCRYIMCPAS